jgi:hypothetical protein
VNEKTATAAGPPIRQRLTWRKVHEYPQLDYVKDLPWDDVPLLSSVDPMVEELDCEDCQRMLPVAPWPFVASDSWSYRDRSGKMHKMTGKGGRICPECRAERDRQRETAAAQGWNWDTAERLEEKVSEKLKIICEHSEGMQLEGTHNIPNRMPTLKVHYVCIKCGRPTPKDKLTNAQRARMELERQLIANAKEV